jgi:trans-2,3-dihydro-3-hydroxyanthranilate isomerase
MSNNPLYLLDVFAESKYSGNQLAVIRVKNPLSDSDMQRIAREINFSETTFILSETPRNGGYDVRIFTPGEEVPFAGHPTLGTAHVIRNEIIGDLGAIKGPKNHSPLNPLPSREGQQFVTSPLAGEAGVRGTFSGGIKYGQAETIVLNLKVGQIPVTFGSDGISWMKQIEPSFGKQLSAETLALVLGLNMSEIDARFPIEEVSTGLPHILVPLRSLGSLKRARVDRDLYFDLIKNTWAKPIMIFCPESHEKKNDISTRMFADAFGIPEDPATGSGNGCLAGYLVKHRYLGKTEIDIRSEQGYEMGRPSLLYLRADEANGRINVLVGGKVVTVAKGQLV